MMCFTFPLGRPRPMPKASSKCLNKTIVKILFPQIIPTDSSLSRKKTLPRILILIFFLNLDSLRHLEQLKTTSNH